MKYSMLCQLEWLIDFFFNFHNAIHSDHISKCFSLTQMFKNPKILSQNYFFLEEAALIYLGLNSLLNFRCL